MQYRCSVDDKTVVFNVKGIHTNVVIVALIHIFNRKELWQDKEK